MRASALIGALLVVLGIAALAYRGFSYTEREKVVDIGPIEATTEEKKTVPVPPVIAVLAIAGGVVLLITGMRRSG